MIRQILQTLKHVAMPHVRKSTSAGMENPFSTTLRKSVVAFTLICAAFSASAAALRFYSDNSAVSSGIWFTANPSSIADAVNNPRPITSFTQLMDLPWVVVRVVTDDYGYMSGTKKIKIELITDKGTFVHEYSEYVYAYENIYGYDYTCSLNASYNLPTGQYTVRVTASCDGYASATASKTLRITSSPYSLAHGLGCADAVANGWVSLASVSGYQPWIGGDLFAVSGAVGKNGQSAFKMTANRNVYLEHNAYRHAKTSSADRFEVYNSGGQLLGRLCETADSIKQYRGFLREGEAFLWVFTRDSSDLELQSFRAAELNGMTVRRTIHVGFNANGGKADTYILNGEECVPGAPYNYLDGLVRYPDGTSQKFPEDGPTPPDSNHKFVGWYNAAGEKITGSSIVPENATDHTLTAKWEEGEKPDLVVSQAYADNYTIYESDSVHIYNRVENIGGKAASETQTTYTYGKHKKSLWCPSLAKGAHQDQDKTFYGSTLGVGTHVITITADGGEVVDEESENNNTASVTITVLADPPPPFPPSPPDGYCTVTFDGNGGTPSEKTRQVKKGDVVGDLPTATRDGHKFNGWWTASDGGTQITASTIITSDVTFYAHWQKSPGVETYTVIFHRNNSANDGATTGQKYKFTAGISSALPKVAEELKWAPRDGYTFLGWARSATATTAQYTDGQSVSLSSTPGVEVHLYGVWKRNAPEKYTVVFHRNNSANDGATSKWTTFEVGVVLALPKIAEELKWAPRDGYTFLGWARSATATTAQYTDGQKVSLSSTPGAEVHLYGVWRAQTYVVRLHRNNSANDGATTGQKYKFTAGISSALPTIESELEWAPRDGYAFIGWATSATATNAQYADGQSVSLSSTPGAEVHLYAVWKAQTYVVRLHRNNSAKDTATAGRTFTAGVGKALPKAAELKWTPRTGYTFLGWATTASATAAKYADGATVNLSSTAGAEVHLYAVWKAQTYVVRLHRNNSAKDTATAGRTFTAGIGKALPKMADELKWAPRTGYAFLGWATTASATAAKYADGQRVSLSSTPGAAVHLYAVWKAQTYVVRLHRNNSAKDTATAGRTFTAGIGKALPKAAELKWAPRTGYSFLGWATSANSTAAKYADGATVNLSSTAGAEVHLYAVWKAQTYTVRLHRNNSAKDTATAGRIYTIGAGRALPKMSALKWLREDYSFEGWATSANATVAKYTDGQTVSNLTTTPGATVHLYAVWKAKTYTVKLYRNNSAGDTSSTGRTFTIGKSRALPTLSELKWTRAGYTFLGWTVSRNSMDVKYWDGQTVSGLSKTANATVNLYAVWVAGDNKYIVRLHRNLSSSDGATAGRTFTVGAGRVLPTLAELNWSRPGYEFLGWATSAGATKAQYANGQNVSGLSNKSGVIVHLYAVWKVGTYVVRLYRNNSPDDGATAGRTFTIYHSRALPTIEELGWGRKGYTFAAWLYPEKSGEVSAFYDGETVLDLTIQPGKVVELFAVWR